MRTILFLVMAALLFMTSALTAPVAAQDSFIPQIGDTLVVTATTLNVRAAASTDSAFVDALHPGDVIVPLQVSPDNLWVYFSGVHRVGGNVNLSGWSLVHDKLGDTVVRISQEAVPTVESQQATTVTVCHQYEGGVDTVYQVNQQNAAGEVCSSTGAFVTQVEAQAFAAGAGGAGVSFDHIPFTDGNGDQFATKWWWESLCSKLPQQQYFCAQDADMQVARPVRALQPFVAANGDSTDALAWNVFMTVKCSINCDAGQVALQEPTHIQFTNAGTQTAVFELTVWQDTSCALDPVGDPCKLSSHPYWNPVNSVAGSTANALFINGRDVTITSTVLSNVDGAELNREVYNVGTVDYSTECTSPVVPDLTPVPDDAFAPKEWASIAPATCEVDQQTNFFRRWMPGTNLVYQYTIEVPVGSHADWWIGQLVLPPNEVVFGTDMQGPTGGICIASESLANCSNLSLADYLAQVG